MRMIDGDALRDNLQALAYDDWNQGVTTSWADAYREVADMVEEMPTIEERKTGRWIETEEQVGWETERTCECSNCGLSFPLDDWTIDEVREEMHYCYQCGAKMEVIA